MKRLLIEEKTRMNNSSLNDIHYNLRSVTSSDEGFLYQVVSSTVVDQVEKMGGDVKQLVPLLQFQFENQNWEYQQRYPNAIHQIIEHANQDIGRLYIDYTGDDIYILDITILPKYRNRGIGTKVLQDIQTQARRGNRPIHIFIEDFNPSLNLFNRLGFRIIDKLGEVHNLLEWKPDK